MTTDPSSDVLERLRLLASGHLRSPAAPIVREGIATIERLSAELERAFREGWAKGYRAGVIDGGSDSSWCDEEGDWQNSETRAALSGEWVMGDTGRSPSGRATHERSRVAPSPPTVSVPNAPAHDVLSDDWQDHCGDPQCDICPPWSGFESL